MAEPLRILLSAPAYWPAHSFGGPIQVMRHLAAGTASRGHSVDVFTTSLSSLEAAGSWSTRTLAVDGVRVNYLSTPVRFRWMGFTPSVFLHLERAARPDVAHVFGFRDPLGTAVATWCTARKVPYVFEGLGMVTPKLRKLRLKRVLDATVLRGVMRGAALLVAASELERREYLAAGLPDARIAKRPNGFPEPNATPLPGALRELIGVEATTPLLLSVGRIARGKGLDLLLGSLAELPTAHAAIVGPDGGHGMSSELLELRDRLGLERRVHFLGELPSHDLPALYADADVFVLPSQHENFGMVAAEAAATGTPVVVTDRCGVAEYLGDRGGIVVPYDDRALTDALSRLVADEPLRRELGQEARAVASEWSWTRVVEIQESIYRRALADG